MRKLRHRTVRYLAPGQMPREWKVLFWGVSWGNLVEHFHLQSSHPTGIKTTVVSWLPSSAHRVLDTPVLQQGKVGVWTSIPARGPTTSFHFQGASVRKKEGISPAVQWLRFCTSSAGGVGSIPCQGTKTPPNFQQGQTFKKKEKRKTEINEASKANSKLWI